MYNVICVIAGLPIRVNTDDLGLVDFFSAFIDKSNPDPLLVIDLVREPVLAEIQGQSLYDDTLKWVKPQNKYYEIGVYVKRTDGTIYTSMEVDNKWSRARVKYLLDDNMWKWKSTLSLLEILFRNSMIFNEGIVLHSSAIEWQGKAIAFTAPAGTGKTTQANLWKQYMGARVLNGDRPALKITGNRVFVYGTPWSGSSKEFINEKAPLISIVLLEQAKVNTIKRLSLIEAIALVIPRFFLPYNDKFMMELAMSIIERILKITPIYLLKCTPDREAVQKLYTELMNNNVECE